jgi:hypothetical protein
VQQQQQAALQDVAPSTVALLSSLCDRHRMAVTSAIMATSPFSLPGSVLFVGLLGDLSAWQHPSRAMYGAQHSSRL